MWLDMHVGHMGHKVQCLKFQAPVKVSEVLTAANLTAEASGKKLKFSWRGREWEVTPDTELREDSGLLYF